MGFFASISFLWYVIVIACIVLSVRGIFGIFGWLIALTAIGRARKAVKRVQVDGDGRSGGFRWTLD